jgi:hypothetical protein
VRWLNDRLSSLRAELAYLNMEIGRQYAAMAVGIGLRVKRPDLDKATGLCGVESGDFTVYVNGTAVAVVPLPVETRFLAEVRAVRAFQKFTSPNIGQPWGASQ